MTDYSPKTDILLIALRKVIQAIDLHSKKLVQQYGLTGPQLLLLKVIYRSGDQMLNSTQLARYVSLSQATVTSILDRLLEKGYVVREKSSTDKRQTHIRATAKTAAVFAQNPALLQPEFLDKFNQLLDWEQSQLVASVERIADMMKSG